MAVLTVATLSRAGVDVAGAAADAGGDQWLNTGKEYVHVRNAAVGAITVTLDIKEAPDGLAVVDKTVTVGPGVTKAIGPFPVGIYNDPATGLARIAYSAVTTVYTKVVKAP